MTEKLSIEELRYWQRWSAPYCQECKANGFSQYCSVNTCPRGIFKDKINNKEGIEMMNEDGLENYNDYINK